MESQLLVLTSTFEKCSVERRALQMTHWWEI